MSGGTQRVGQPNLNLLPPDLLRAVPDVGVDIGIDVDAVHNAPHPAAAAPIAPGAAATPAAIRPAAANAPAAVAHDMDAGARDLAAAHERVAVFVQLACETVHGSMDAFGWPSVLAAMRAVPCLRSLPLPLLRKLYDDGDALRFARGQSVTRASVAALTLVLRGTAAWQATVPAAVSNKGERRIGARGGVTQGSTMATHGWTADPSLLSGDERLHDAAHTDESRAAALVASAGGEWVVTSASLHAVVLPASALLAALESDGHLLACASGGGAAVAAHVTSFRDAPLHLHASLCARLLGRLRGSTGSGSDATAAALELRLLAAANAECGAVEVVGAVVDATAAFLGARVVSLLEVVEARRCLLVRESSCGTAIGVVVPSSGLAGEAASSGSSVLVPDTRSHRRYTSDVDAKVSGRADSVMYVPVWATLPAQEGNGDGEDGDYVETVCAVLEIADKAARGSGTGTGGRALAWQWSVADVRIAEVAASFLSALLSQAFQQRHTVSGCLHASCALAPTAASVGPPPPPPPPTAAAAAAAAVAQPPKPGLSPRRVVEASHNGGAHGAEAALGLSVVPASCCTQDIRWRPRLLAVSHVPPSAAGVHVRACIAAGDRMVTPWSDSDAAPLVLATSGAGSSDAATARWAHTQPHMNEDSYATVALSASQLAPGCRLIVEVRARAAAAAAAAEPVAWGSVDAITTDGHVVSGCVRVPLVSGPCASWWPRPPPACTGDVAVGPGVHVLDVELLIAPLSHAAVAPLQQQQQAAGDAPSVLRCQLPIPGTVPPPDTGVAWAQFGMPAAIADAGSGDPTTGHSGNSDGADGARSNSSQDVSLAIATLHAHAAAAEHGCDVFHPPHWSSGERCAIWAARDALLRASPHLLPVLVKCSTPLSPQAHRDVMSLIRRCGAATEPTSTAIAAPLPATVWLQLLHACVASPAVRAAAVARLDLAPATPYATALLLPLLCATAHERHLDTAVTRLILRRALADPLVQATTLAHALSLSAGTRMSARMQCLAQALLRNTSAPVRQQLGVQLMAFSQLSDALTRVAASPREQHTAVWRRMLASDRALLPAAIAVPLSSAAANASASGVGEWLLGLPGRSSAAAVAAGARPAGSRQVHGLLHVGTVQPYASYVLDVDAARGSVRAVAGFHASSSTSSGAGELLLVQAPRSVLLAWWVHAHLANVMGELWRVSGCLLTRPESASGPLKLKNRAPDSRRRLPAYDLAVVRVVARSDASDAIQDRLPSQLLALMPLRAAGDAPVTLLPRAVASAAVASKGRVGNLSGLAWFLRDPAATARFISSLAAHVVLTYVLALGPRDGSDLAVLATGELTLLDLGCARIDGEPDPLLQPPALDLLTTSSAAASSPTARSPRFANARTLAQLLAVLGYGPGAVGSASSAGAGAGVAMNGARRASGGVDTTASLEAVVEAACDAFSAVRENAHVLLPIAGMLMPMGTAGMESDADMAALRHRLFLHKASAAEALASFSVVVLHLLGVADAGGDQDSVWLLRGDGLPNQQPE